jgi:response regulator RpfG family c-di-GMP phosphodiesterase
MRDLVRPSVPPLSPGVPRRKRLLLCDPESLFRRTVALVARDLDLADIREASSIEAASKLLGALPFDGLLLDIGDGIDAFGLVQDVRTGKTRTDHAVPIVLTAATCDAGTIAFFKPMAVQRNMLKPFKVKTVLEVIATLAAPGGVPAP